MSGVEPVPCFSEMGQRLLDFLHRGVCALDALHRQQSQQGELLVPMHLLVFDEALFSFSDASAFASSSKRNGRALSAISLSPKM
jgi:hypothetical protein